MNKPANIDEYISGYPATTREKLQALRAAIQKTAPQAEEVISYAIPAFKLQGMLVWYAAYAGHICFYPGASGIAAFKQELSKYKGAKGSVQFPLDKPLPLALVKRIVKFRMNENLQKVAAKKK
jgi:uncharacterized protein YdhG (YjbR/CyaY superfamily)